MIVRDLHRYRGTNGKVDTLIELPMEGEPMKRLEAEIGMMLTDGETVASVIDVPAADVDKWSEVEATPESGIDTNPDATEADYIAALNELGVNTDEES